MSLELREYIGRKIYESQQQRLTDQKSSSPLRKWRSTDVPSVFWEHYCLDADAAILGLDDYMRYPERFK